jgi:hypothetical protein
LGGGRRLTVDLLRQNWVRERVFDLLSDSVFAHESVPFKAVGAYAELLVSE